MSEELLYFQEDAQEQLQLMESALLDAIEQGASDESVGTIFRAMHTIKGVAGMFGFEQLISFTHIAENLMESVRAGVIMPSEELLALMLECKDHVALLVDAAVASESLGSATAASDALLRQRIEHYLNPQENSLETATSNTQQLWEISLGLKEHFFESGMDLLSILAYLNKIGKIQKTRIDMQKLPTLESIDPFIPYVTFSIDFLTDVSREDIVEVFEFVEDDIDLELRSLLLEEPSEEKSDLEIDGFEILDEPDEPDEQIAPHREPKPITKDLEIKKEQKTKSTESQSLRVDSQKVDALIDTISEMVVLNAQIAQHVEESRDAVLEDISLELETLLQTLRNNVMQMRMLSVGDSFEKFRRVVSDVARKLDKKIDFTISGGDTELDKTVIEKISDPLVHMLRNAVDHGIESPQKRQELAKSERGNIALRAYPESGSIVIEIEDDGAGLCADKLIEKAEQKGLIPLGAQLSDMEAYQLIFAPGFSTAQQLSDISGRGVGMDVVKKNIESLKGEITLTSQEGKGSCFTIRLPLTLAIIEGFLFQVGDIFCIIPLDMIAEVIEYDKERQSAEHQLLDLRGTLIPLLDLKEFYKTGKMQECTRENVIVVRYGDKNMGLLVDELFGENQTVIKSLGGVFKNAPAFYGASVLGNGEIALIMDIPALFNLVKNKE